MNIVQLKVPIRDNIIDIYRIKDNLLWICGILDEAGDFSSEFKEIYEIMVQAEESGSIQLYNKEIGKILDNIILRSSNQLLVQVLKDIKNEIR